MMQCSKLLFRTLQEYTRLL